MCLWHHFEADSAIGIGCYINCGFEVLLMRTVIENKKDKLIQLCEKYEIAELYVFGSATTESFDPGRSDIDFLVKFKPSVARHRFDNFFNFLEELNQLFNRPVDLVEPGGLRNPYFKEMVNKTKQMVYVAT